MRSGDYLEGMINDYVGGIGKAKRRAQKSTSSRLVAFLTCLQFTFAIYATCLIYYMGATVDLRTKPELAWATRIAQRWKQFIIHPNVLGHYQKNYILQSESFSPSQVCESEKIDFLQMKSNDNQMIKFKRGLYDQTVPFHSIWVLAFSSPNEHSLKRIVGSYNNSKISFISSSYDFKYYDEYKNSVLGSIGRILPFRQDSTFPSYRTFRSKEAGLYLPDPAYDIIVNRIVQVDFLSSSWFLSADLVKTLFVESPLTFMTGEDLHLSYQLQKYRNAASFVLPVDPNDKETWGNSEHRLAYVSETTVIFKDIVQVRDDQWRRALSTG
ncbi:hypothetical protein MRB53_004178 [Persea americana]|uniref:Uncharacterized protein n=1 Tax=Persea americana TaxID=3435 RepID=A0ACC2N099_PERAE|nr:hypothetical protein MRB53_004178 [Persea americana]